MCRGVGGGTGLNSPGGFGALELRFALRAPSAAAAFWLHLWAGKGKRSGCGGQRPRGGPGVTARCSVPETIAPPLP